MSQNLHRQQREAGFREGGRWRQFYGPTAVTDVTRRGSARAFVTRGRFTGHDVMAGFMGNGGCLVHGIKHHPLVGEGTYACQRDETRRI